MTFHNCSAWSFFPERCLRQDLRWHVDIRVITLGIRINHQCPSTWISLFRCSSTPGCEFITLRSLLRQITKRRIYFCLRLDKRVRRTWQCWVTNHYTRTVLVGSTIQDWIVGHIASSSLLSEFGSAPRFLTFFQLQMSHLSFAIEQKLSENSPMMPNGSVYFARCDALQVTCIDADERRTLSRPEFAGEAKCWSGGALGTGSVCPEACKCCAS